MNESNIDSVLSNFRLFLERSFDHIDSIYRGNENEADLEDAWLQANLLDSKLIDLDDPELDLEFNSFCYSHGGFYYPFQAPLNSVLLTSKHDLVTVSLSCVTFKKTPIK